MRMQKFNLELDNDIKKYHEELDKKVKKPKIIEKGTFGEDGWFYINIEKFSYFH
jgi:hypothetical protein